MANLPHNVERVRDGAGFRYRAYSADGFVVRLNNPNGDWDAYANLTGAYLGRGRTLAEIGAKAGATTIRTTYAQAMAARVAGMAAWNHTADELANIVRGRRNGAGIRLTFADGSAAFIGKGSAAVRVVA